MATKWIRKSVKDFPAPFTLSTDIVAPLDYSENDLWWWFWHPHVSTDVYYTDGRFLIIKNRYEGEGKPLGWYVIDTRYMVKYPSLQAKWNLGLTLDHAQRVRESYRDDPLQSQGKRPAYFYKNYDYFYRDIVIPLDVGLIGGYYNNVVKPFEVDDEDSEYFFLHLEGAKNFVELMLWLEKECVVFGIINQSDKRFTPSVGAMVAEQKLIMPTKWNEESRKWEMEDSL